MYSYYAIMTGLPVVGTAYGIWYVATHTQEYSNIALLGMIGLELSIVVSVTTFLVCLSIYVCSRCVNFSCLFNTVEKPVVDEFLRMNPVMKEAWERTGYQLD